jgi:hypothetical protein
LNHNGGFSEKVVRSDFLHYKAQYPGPVKTPGHSKNCFQILACHLQIVKLKKLVWAASWDFVAGLS